MSEQILRAMFAAAKEERYEFQRRLVDAAERLSTAANWYAVAVGHTLLGEHEAAISLLEELLKIKPDWEQARMCLAMQYADAAHPARAMGIFEVLKQNGSADVRKIAEERQKALYPYLSEPRRLAAARLTRANAMVAIVAQPSRHAAREATLAAFPLFLVDPNDVDILLPYGFALALARRRDQALAVVAQLLTLAPNEHVVQWNVGEILLMLEELHQARECYERALDLARDDEDRGQARARLAALALRGAASETLPGQVLFDDLVVIRRLGSGGMGTVTLVEERLSGKHWALKRVKEPDPVLRSALLREIQVHLDLPHHPHLVSLGGLRSAGEDIGILSEFVEGCSLHHWIASAPRQPSEVLDKIIQLALGVEALHAAGFAHLDVKPGNALVDRDGVVRLVDFGLSINVVENVLASFGVEPLGPMLPVPAGTLSYQSPEQSAGLRETSNKSDVWSFGVSCVHLLCGDVTWSTGLAAPEVLEALADRGALVVGLKEILIECFENDWQRRPRMENVVTRLLAVERATGRVRDRKPRSEPKVHSVDHVAMEADAARRGFDWHSPESWLKTLRAALPHDPDGLRLAVQQQLELLSDKLVTAYLADRGYEMILLDAFEQVAQLASQAARYDIVAGARCDEARFRKKMGDSSGALMASRQAEEAARALPNDLEARYHGGRAARLRGLICLAADHAAAFDAFSIAVAALETLPLTDRRHAIELGLALAMTAQFLEEAGRHADAIAHADRCVQMLGTAEGPPELELARTRMRALIDGKPGREHVRTVTVADGRLQVSNDPGGLLRYLLELVLSEGDPPERMFAPNSAGLAYRDRISALRVSSLAVLPEELRAAPPIDPMVEEVWQVARWSISSDVVLLRGDELRALGQRAAALWSATAQKAPSDILPFPIGGTLGDGRFVITEPLSGGLGRGQYRARDVNGVAFVATVTLEQTRDHDDTAKALEFPSPRIAPIRHAGPLDVIYDGERYDALLEEEPAGERSHTFSPFGEKPAIALALAVAEALTDCHRRGFALGTLRPELIYLTRFPGGLELAGLAPRGERFFATARPFRDIEVLGFTHLYLAPELFRKVDPEPPADVYSLCAILAEWSTGDYPFSNRLMTKRRPWVGSLVLGKLIDRGLERMPQSRISLTDLVAALKSLAPIS